MSYKAELAKPRYSAINVNRKNSNKAGGRRYFWKRLVFTDVRWLKHNQFKTAAQKCHIHRDPSCISSTYSLDYNNDHHHKRIVGSLRLHVSTQIAWFLQHWTESFIIILEDSVAGDFYPHTKQKTCQIPYIFESTRERWLESIVNTYNWHSTNN